MTLKDYQQHSALKHYGFYKVMNGGTRKIKREYKKKEIELNSAQVDIEFNGSSISLGNGKSSSFYGSIDICSADVLMHNAEDFTRGFAEIDKLKHIIFNFREGISADIKTSILESKLAGTGHLILSFIRQVSIAAKKHNIKAYVITTPKGISKPEARAIAIMDKYLAYIDEYNKLDTDKKYKSGFYLISAEDFSWNNNDFSNTLEVLMGLQESHFEDVYRNNTSFHYEAMNKKQSKEEWNKIKDKKEMFFIQTLVARAYRLSIVSTGLLSTATEEETEAKLEIESRNWANYTRGLNMYDLFKRIGLVNE